MWAAREMSGGIWPLPHPVPLPLLCAVLILAALAPLERRRRHRAVAHRRTTVRTTRATRLNVGIHDSPGGT